jgi:hypothetical protein
LRSFSSDHILGSSKHVWGSAAGPIGTVSLGSRKAPQQYLGTMKIIHILTSRPETGAREKPCHFHESARSWKYRLMAKTGQTSRTKHAKHRCRIQGKSQFPAKLLQLHISLFWRMSLCTSMCLYITIYICIGMSQMEKTVAHPGTTFDGNVFLKKETCDSGREKG